MLLSLKQSDTVQCISKCENDRTSTGTLRNQKSNNSQNVAAKTARGVLLITLSHSCSKLLSIVASEQLFTALFLLSYITYYYFLVSFAYLNYLRI